MAKPEHNKILPVPVAGWRLGVASVLIALSLSSALFIPLVQGMDLSTEAKTAISGSLVLGLPQLLMFIAVTLVGKPGFNYIKGRVGRFFKQFGPPKTVSKNRYRIGLLLFFIPVLLGLLTPYVSNLVPDYESNRVYMAVGGDIMFLTSLFVLGGDFWDKLRALFIYGSKAVFPKKTG
ncbi:MAG: hypothetical protein WBN49_10380 [Arenicellales bacterium]